MIFFFGRVIYDRHLFNLGTYHIIPRRLGAFKTPTKRLRRHFAIMGCAAGSTVKYLEVPGGLKARNLKGSEEQTPTRNSRGEMVKDFLLEIHGSGSLDVHLEPN